MASTTTGLIPNWFPPNRDNYELILSYWKWFPLVLSPSPFSTHHHPTDIPPQLASLQWLISWYGMGKTSVHSRLNLPGRVGWLAMEAPGFLTLLYHLHTLPEQAGIDELPWQNKVLAGLFVIRTSARSPKHYHTPQQQKHRN